MKIAITTFGMPNLESAQSNADPLLYASKLKKKHTVKIFVISNHIFFQSIKSELFYKKIIEKKYDIPVTLVKFKNYNLLNKIYNKIININPFWQFEDRNKILIKKIHNFKPDIIFNFLERAIVATQEIKIKKINYLGIPPNLVEKYRKKFFKPWNVLKILNSKIFLFKYEIFKKKIYNSQSHNLCLCDQSYNEYKKYVKKIKLIKPLSIKKKLNKLKKNKVQQILMIGNLRSSFVHDGLEQLVKLKNDLEKIYQNKEFKINIVGKFQPENWIFQELKNFRWINFVGWVENVNHFFSNSDFLLVLNINKLGVRTKILDSLSCGLPVLTFKSNIFKNSKFLNMNNMLIAKNKKDMLKKFNLLLFNYKIKKKIHENSLKLYNRNYEVSKIIKNTEKIITSLN